MTGGELSKRERLAIPRQQMPVRDRVERAGGFGEVNLGFTEQLAPLEARRCLDCKAASCIKGCPVMVDIPRLVTLIEAGDRPGAARSLFGDNAASSVTGRVCPQ